MAYATLFHLMALIMMYVPGCELVTANSKSGYDVNQKLGSELPLGYYCVFPLELTLCEFQRFKNCATK